jgi:LmbE family N-acetylglucosaminyl deacetylase
VAAHPDDEVLGCGGLVASRSNDCDFHLVIVAEGVTSRDPQRDSGARAEGLRQLREETEAAAAILGFRTVHHLGLPDNRLDSLSLLDVVKAIEEVTRDVKPDLVLTHHDGDLNVDHRIVSQAVLTVFRPVPDASVRLILAFEVLSSTEYSAGRALPQFIPNLYVDIDQAVEKKKLAMRAYASECQRPPLPRNEEGIEILARKRGLEVGLNAAEAFLVLRLIAV